MATVADYTTLLARIIQGEAGGMGNPGMMACADTLNRRIWQQGQPMERIAREYYGRAEPSKFAELLAELIAGAELPASEYSFIYSYADVTRGGYPIADYFISQGQGGDGNELHLYREWPVETLRKLREQADYHRAAGAVPWREGDESGDITIRRTRG